VLKYAQEDKKKLKMDEWKCSTSETPLRDQLYESSA
jgi:hypothetical protein